MKYMRDIPDLKGKKVLLRTDFDVPVSKEGEILESFRVERQKTAVDQLIDAGATVVMVAHIAAMPSFEPLVPQFEKILGRKIKFLDEPDGQLEQLNLLDNVRTHEGEEKNDTEFAQKLAQGFDLYVNNAFAVSHRNHASVSA